jgi:hypothetical protein
MPSSDDNLSQARQATLRTLSAALGHEFADLALLDRALTHASLGNEGKKSYERLEFLGDAFLNFAVADVLYKADTEVAEGQLTESRARIDVFRASVADSIRRTEPEGGPVLRGLAFIAAREVRDEELFLNYQFETRPGYAEAPAWYTPVRPAA